MAPRVAVSLLDLVTGNLAREEPLHVVRGETDIVRVGDGVERRGLQLVLRVAGDSAQRLVDKQPAAVHVHERHANRSIAEGGLEALAHLLETLLRLLALLFRALARDDLALESSVELSDLPFPVRRNR